MVGMAKLIFLLLALNSACTLNVPLSVISNLSRETYRTAIELAVTDINENPLLLPNIEIILNYQLIGRAPGVIEAMIELESQDVTLIVGNEYSSVSEITGIVGNVYGIAQLSSAAVATNLSNKQKYPFYSRLAAPGFSSMLVTRDAILYFSSVGGRGWSDIAVVSHTDNYGLELAITFIDNIGPDIELLTFQQFLYQSEDYSVELREIDKSGARVIVGLMYPTEWTSFVIAADSFGLIGDQYVWFVPEVFVTTTLTPDDTVDIYALSRGICGTVETIVREGPVFNAFNDRWLALDPEAYPGAGAFPNDLTLLEYDMVHLAAHAIQALHESGELDQQRVPAEVWTGALRNVTFDGVSGRVRLDESGDRIANLFSFSYYNPDIQMWEVAGLWDEENGFQLQKDVVWFSNTTELPDLDIRDPFGYWSCKDGEEGYDPTGKAISLNTPDRSSFDEIESTYHCDHFIDCWNLSDESKDCAQNYTVLFIVFGIVTGVLILITVVLIIFVLIFGLVLKYQRLRVASPFFLLIMLLSILLGYISVFAWFGKPHPVACFFQPILLGISAISMITALCVKTFRIWRIFRSELRKQRITDFELLALWILTMIPVCIIIIIWLIVSTPTAAMRERDGVDHYVCTTGGFTGEPGGYIFFGILVGYGALVLVFGVFLTIVTRNVPALFNESKLLAISIYNLGFLSVVIIPVFLVVQPFNPFIAWILRTCAILYAFTATLFLQFFPPVMGIVLLDCCRNKDLSSKITMNSTSNSKRTASNTS